MKVATLGGARGLSAELEYQECECHADACMVAATRRGEQQDATVRSSIVWIEWQLIAAMRSGDPETAEARGGVAQLGTACGQPSGRRRCWLASALPVTTCDTPRMAI